MKKHQNANVRPAEPGPYSAPSPEDEIPQALQMPDRAAILERDRLGICYWNKRLAILPSGDRLFPDNDLERGFHLIIIRVSIMQFADHLAQTMFSFRLGKGWALGPRPSSAVGMGAGTQMNRTQREPLARFNRQSQDLAKSIGVYPPSLPTPSSRAGAFF